MIRERPPVDRLVFLVGGVLFAVLVLFAGRYGYHRDELYFMMLGRRPAFGYVDQPPLIPLLAAAMDILGGGSLALLRVPPALAAAAATIVVGLTAREFGAGRRGQVVAASAWAISAVVLASGHLAGTTAFDLLIWAALSLLVVRALPVGGRRWLPVGIVLGIGLQVKSLVLLFPFAIVIGLLLVGPRAVLRDRWFWIAALLAAVIWSPNLVWQALHGWPQLAMSAAIAGGGSGTSEPRWLFLPFQLVLLSPVVVPLLVVGWWRLWSGRLPAVWRCFAVMTPLLATVLIAGGGKPYYLCGAMPVLVAAGAQPVADRLGRVLPGLLAFALAVNALMFLPIVPVDRLAGNPVTAINYDAGETVGWPQFAAAVRAATRDLPAGSAPIVVTRDYGQAGAVARFAPEIEVYSGHNSLAAFGPPPSATAAVVLVGYQPEEAAQWFASVRPVETYRSPYGLDNDADRTPLLVVGAPRAGWESVWSAMRAVG